MSLLKHLAVKFADLAFDIKAEDGSEQPGRFTGKASVFGVVDSYNDAVMPGAFTKTIAENGGTVVLLHQHDPAQPIGLVELHEGEDALYVKGRINLETQLGRDVYSNLKAGILNGLSIGYETISHRWEKAVRQLLEVRLWEVSIVTFPANTFARVSAIKAGRVLSAASRKAITDARDACRQAAEVLEGLLTTADAADDADSKAGPDLDTRALDNLLADMSATLRQ